MKSLALIIFTILILITPHQVASQGKQLPDCIQGIGPLGDCVTSTSKANIQFADIVSITIGVMTVGAGIWFIFQIIVGAISWIGSAGDKAQLQTSQKRITNAVIGLVIVIAAVTITSLVGELLGFPILNIDIGSLVQ